MTFAKSIASVAVLSVMLGAAGAASAQTSEQPTAIGCLHMEKKVEAALDANQQSPSYHEASNRASDARGFCAQRLYKMGVDRYSAVLTMLGAS